MKVTIYGAGNEVTGSSFELQTDKARILIDCGQFQGGPRDENRNRLPRGLNVNKLNAVVVTHGHLDHVGRLPLLVLRGYTGPIYATPATIDVANLILRDAAKVQEAEVERENRRRERAGQEPLSPLFTDEDVQRTMHYFKPVNLNTPTPIAPGISVRMLESGHILGSAMQELTVEDAGKTRTIVFTGDIGSTGMPILNDPQRLTKADWIFMESTYGDRDHRPLDETVKEFTRLIQDAVARKGKILVPAFALGRTQQMLYHLAEISRAGIIPPFPIYVDSPLGIATTEVYSRHPELFDKAMREFVSSGQLAKAMANVKYCQTADESKALNNVPGTCLILAGSGMCTAGRILHHLKHNLWKQPTTVIFVGYQAPGSLGRQLIEGRNPVTIFGETIAVNATIRSLGGFSAHAGQSELLNWFSSLAPARPRLTLIHGEDRARKPLARKIQERFGITAELPTTQDILTD